MGCIVEVGNCAGEQVRAAEKKERERGGQVRAATFSKECTPKHAHATIVQMQACASVLAYVIAHNHIPPSAHKEAGGRVLAYDFLKDVATLLIIKIDSSKICALRVRVFLCV